MNYFVKNETKNFKKQKKLWMMLYIYIYI
jgi:hypothetical protein